MRAPGIVASSIAKGSVVGDPHWANVVLAMYMDGANNGTTFTEEKGKTVTRFGHTVTKTDQKKFGTASAYFDGSGDYLRLATSNDWDFGSGDFTIEAWVRISTFAVTRGVVARRDNTSTGNANNWSLRVTTGAQAQFYITNSSSVVVSIYSGTLTVNTWHFLTVCRVSGVITIYLDGVVGQNATSSASIVPQSL